MDLKEQILDMGVRARRAGRAVARTSGEARNDALEAMASAIEAASDELKSANAVDLENARASGISKAMLNRLAITDSTIASMASGLREVAAQPDPVGEVIKMWRRPNGLLVGKKRIPLGVIGIIYESRPNVTADAAGLCLKAGNAVILRGGSEAINSNRVLARILSDAAKSAGMPADAIQVVATTERDAVVEMLKLEEYIDLIIPRGGEGLIRFVTQNSMIPVVKHYKGVCHVYVDEFADMDMAAKIAVNAKAQRPGVCNSLETLLVHEKIANSFLPLVAKAMQNAGVELRGCSKTMAILPEIKEAGPEDWDAEYLDLILAVKVVGSLDEAVDHIADHGSLHTESIITNDYRNANKFIDAVNSSTVMVNASTRFSDGQQLGLGAEIGISTTKIHSFGPMGAEDLTTTKFIIYGDGQIREK